MKLALAQSHVTYGDPFANLERAKSWVGQASGSDLVVFPECFLTGYCVDTPDEAARVALECRADASHRVVEAHSAIVEMGDLARSGGVALAFGFAGRDERGLYNGVVLAQPDGRMDRYVKTHLPCLGFDRFAREGDDLPVFDTPFGRVGILVCFDVRPPEAARVLALKGADLIVVATNWPNGASKAPDVLVPARAVENRVFVAACNRVGSENGYGFIGRSSAVDPTGAVLCSAAEDETLLVAELDLAASREKVTVVQPYGYSTDLFGSRRPELYGAICTKNA